jgi:AAA+ ATPase superfamily predicted ATPase
MNKGGIAIMCVGRRKTGKTTLSKEFLTKRAKHMPCLVYDVNKEYADFYNKPLMKWNEFLKFVSLGSESGKLVNTYILVEEATIFFNTQSNFEEMKDILVRARHTGNIIQLNFHSFSSVPKGIYNLLDYVIVLKTNDSEKNVTDRFDNPKVLQAYLNARDSKDEFYNEVVNLY